MFFYDKAPHRLNFSQFFVANFAFIRALNRYDAHKLGFSGRCYLDECL
jgi:hypothetical protein